MELCDFTVGDRVEYDGKGKAPKYLAEYNDFFIQKDRIYNCIKLK